MFVLLKNEIPVLVFFYARKGVVRHRVFYSKAIFINVTGDRVYDAIHIEYNCFLCHRDFKMNFLQIIKSLPEPWDELFLPGLDTKHFPGNALMKNQLPLKVIIDRSVPSPYIDLTLVSKNNGNYLSLISSNTRSQIRRSYRLYETRGPIICAVADRLEMALKVYDEMTAIHQNEWKSRGEEGAFSSKFFYGFHKQLIQDRFNQGEIQLVQVKCGDHTIGCLYNFVYNETVYFYQSGIVHEKENRLKPGMITHVEAVLYNARIGNRIYDFLGSDARYKKSLSTHSNQLIWARVQKPKFKFALEDRLKKLKHMMDNRLNTGFSFRH